MTTRTIRLAALVAAILLPACALAEPGEGPQPGADPAAEAAVADRHITAAQHAFLARYADYCGAAYEGHSVMVDLGDDHPLEGARLRMTVAECSERQVRIPFQVDDDTSRTWILTVTDAGLRMAHDHRYPDGTEYEANFYGGIADHRGDATKQFFPADARTIADRPARDINVWSKAFDLDNQRYYYRLYLRGDLRYEAEFDLSRPLPGDASAPPVPAPAGTSYILALTDVNVIPMDRERVLRNHTVVVRDGRIVEMGPAATVRPPAGAQVIEGAGRYLMPGLSELHAHIPSPQQGEDVIERTLFLYLAGGVTTIRGMLGHPRHLELRELAARSEILSPRIYTSGPSFNGNSAPTPEVARRMVEEHAAAGYDLLKLHPGLSRPVFDAIVEAATRVGIPFAGHVSADVGLDHALASGYHSIDHLDGYIEALAGRRGGWNAQESGWFGIGYMGDVDADGIGALAAATRQAGVWNVPTQSLMEHLLGTVEPEEMARWPEMRYMPAATVEQWAERTRALRGTPAATAERRERYIDARRQIIRALHAAGAGLALGSDAPQMWNVPGFAIHRELRMLVESGLSPFEALATGSRNAALMLGAGDWGTIAPGQWADLVLVRGNPLEDIGNAGRIDGVMTQGWWLPREELDRRLEEVAAAVR
jgi:imidazolonepropionase-like amidohydrolase